MASVESELNEVFGHIRAMVEGQLVVKDEAIKIFKTDKEIAEGDLKRAVAREKTAIENLDTLMKEHKTLEGCHQESESEIQRLRKIKNELETQVRTAKANAKAAEDETIAAKAKAEKVEAKAEEAEAKADKAEAKAETAESECLKLRFELYQAKVQIDQLKKAMNGAEVMRGEDAFGDVDPDETQIPDSPHQTPFKGERSITPPSPLLGYRKIQVARPAGGPAAGGAGGSSAVGSAGATIVITDDSLSPSPSIGSGSKRKANGRAPGQRAAKQRFQYTHMLNAWNSFYNDCTSASAWDLFVDKFVKAATNLEQRHDDLSHLHSIEFSHDFQTDMGTILDVRRSMLEARDANDKSVSANFLKDSIMVLHLATMKRVHKTLQDSRSDSKKNRASKKPASSASKEPDSSASKKPASSASKEPDSSASKEPASSASTNPSGGSSANNRVVKKRGLAKGIRTPDLTESDSSHHDSASESESDGVEVDGVESD